MTRWRMTRGGRRSATRVSPYSYVKVSPGTLTYLVFNILHVRIADFHGPFVSIRVTRSLIFLLPSSHTPHSDRGDNFTATSRSATLCMMTWSISYSAREYRCEDIQLLSERATCATRCIAVAVEGATHALLSCTKWTRSAT